jgi:hypothetical protein
MKAKMKFFGVLGFAILALTFSVLAQDKPNLINQDKKDSSDLERQKKEFYSQFSTAQYDVSEKADFEKKAKRKLKNKRYDNRGGLITNELPTDEDEENMLITHAEPQVGPPAGESEIIVTGEVLDAQAFVSNNKKGVYSEFTIRFCHLPY